MPPISRDEIDSDMQEWFSELQASKTTPSGLPSGAQVQTETIHLTQEQFEQFKANPQEFVSRKSSDNAVNANSDPLFG